MEAWAHALIGWLALPKNGRGTVFLVSLLSATLLPMGSEPAVFGLVKLNPELFWPVVLVVGMRLGCINHALLTAEAIARRELTLAGWVANRIDPAMDCFEANLDTLCARLNAPLLGVVPYGDSPEQAASMLGLSVLPGFAVAPSAS